MNDKNSKEIKSLQNSPKKKKKINHSDLGPNFVAPDGGFGWFICIAAGLSNLVCFQVVQQFGLLYRDRLTALNISSSRITSIININQAATSLIGLANGPMFRRFTYRQVGIVGATFVTVGVLFSAFADSFVLFLITFAIIYGGGVGLTTSSNSLALNTYFKERRRIVTGISWSVTGLGPIVFPFIVTFLIPIYGVTGTVLIFAGIAMNAICFACILQPVMWHVKKKNSNEVKEIECSYCQSLKKKQDGSLFSSQYLFNVDDKIMVGYEIIDPGTPMLAKANDGWFSSNSAKRSLYSSRMSLSSKKPSTQNLAKAALDKQRSSNTEKFTESQPESITVRKNLSSNSFRHNKTSPATPMASRNSFAMPHIFEGKSSVADTLVRQSSRKRTNTFTVEKEILDAAKDKLEEYVTIASEKMIKCTCEDLKQQQRELENRQSNDDDNDDQNFTLWQKISIFFDLDLMKDMTYLNIMFGLIIAHFTEMNFSVLTPFVLTDFGLEKSQIAFCMSILGVTDILCRFTIPFVAGLIGFDNRTFYLIGIVNLAIGRIVLAHFHSYYVAIGVFLWNGFNKGLRTVFMNLCIPSHVPIDRLPAATGLHLLFSGIFYILFGPVIGYIRDNSNYTIALHCLNIATFLCAISWTIEMVITKRREKKATIIDVENLELK
ncbi:uncharacterized protein [Chironomus tepperi]|uniref:uncharacterized protein n=1 Tax=Chironomus tepperi TaxID=113505 RepID=UPI00391F4005